MERLLASALKPRLFWLQSQENRPSRTISMIFVAKLETLSDCFRFKKPQTSNTVQMRKYKKI